MNETKQKCWWQEGAKKNHQKNLETEKRKPANNLTKNKYMKGLTTKP